MDRTTFNNKDFGMNHRKGRFKSFGAFWTFALMGFFCGARLNAQSAQDIPLYRAKIPNSRDAPDMERIERPYGDRFILETSIPTLTVFRPDHPNGKAIIICPGGGYRGVSIDKEGILVARELMRDSITAFVLKYRTPNDRTALDKSLAPLQDAQQAIRHVRSYAGDYKIRPDQIGIMGFSAGGHLAAILATRFDEAADSEQTDSISLRPDFAILIYPVISFDDTLAHKGSRSNLIGENPDAKKITTFSAEKQVSARTPPVFLVHAANDRAVPVGNSLAFYQACLDNGVSAEMHLYPAGGHGFGMVNRTTPDKWMERLKNWLTTL